MQMRDLDDPKTIAPSTRERSPLSRSKPMLALTKQYSSTLNISNPFADHATYHL
jgi:hypothetical protein